MTRYGRNGSCQSNRNPRVNIMSLQISQKKNTHLDKLHSSIYNHAIMPINHHLNLSFHSKDSSSKPTARICVTNSYNLINIDNKSPIHRSSTPTPDSHASFLPSFLSWFHIHKKRKPTGQLQPIPSKSPFLLVLHH